MSPRPAIRVGKPPVNGSSASLMVGPWRRRPFSYAGSVTRRGSAENEDTTPVVSLFSGWADSAVWFGGPIPYGETRLDPALVADIRAWDDGCYADRKPDHAWRSADDAARYHRTAAELAQRLAEQIGREFQVEYDAADTHRHVRAAGPPLHQEAAAAFREMAEQARAERPRTWAVVARAAAEGHVLAWRAYPPSGDDGAPAGSA